MNRKIIIACIAVILLLPMMFMGPHENMTLARYLMKCVMPMIIVGVFVANYQWLVPRTIFSGRRQRFFWTNAALVLACTLILVVWHWIEFLRIKDFYPELFRNRTFLVFAAFRDAINLIFAILLAYTLRMNKHIAQLKQRQAVAEIALRDAEVARRDAELRSLRNQVSPHFLLNTLNNIYALTEISAERTQNAIMQLSRMLRHMLYDNQEEFVTLRSEAEFIQNYINLMRLRITSNVQVDVDIQVAENSQTMIAPLLFISLVENAFKHGITPGETCRISISLHEDDGNVVCNIRNSNHPKKATDHSGHGIGLANVQERLDVLYKDRYQWTRKTEGKDYISEITIRNEKKKEEYDLCNNR